MSELRIAQMMTEQLDQTDPFTRARSMFDQSNQSTMQNQMFQQQTQMPATPEEVKNSGLLVQPLNPLQMMNFEKSDLPKALQKIGVDDKGLAFNDMGRIQLLGRLKAKFGDQYQQNPIALNAISLFDKSINEFQDQKKTSQKTMISNGERTLAALLGGQ